MRFDASALSPELLDDELTYPLLGFIIGARAGAGIPVLDGVPQLHSDPGTVKDLSSSITATQAFVEKVGPRADALLEPSKDAFVQAMHLAVAGSVVMGAIGVVIALLWLPGRNPLAQGGPAAPAVPAQARTEEKVPVVD